MAQTRPQALADAEAAHGLEQQLIHAVVDCLSSGSAGAEITVPLWQQEMDSNLRFPDRSAPVSRAGRPPMTV
jgi:hypothetical protein